MTTVKVRSPDQIRLLPVSDPVGDLQLSSLAASVQYLIAIAMTAVATVVAVGLDSQVAIPNLSLVFVVPVVGAAVAFGLGPSICCAVLGSLAYNFFLTEPRYTFRVDDPANIWAIGLLFVVGVIASAEASTARRRAADAALARRQAAVVQSYSRDIVAAGDATEMVAATANALEALFRMPIVVMMMSEAAVEVAEKRGRIEPQEVDIAAARSALSTGKVSVAGVYPFDAARFDFWPVMTSTASRAVIGLAFDPEERPPQPGTLVEIIGNLLALALDRQRFRTGLDEHRTG